MLIKYITKEKNETISLLIHAGLGLVSLVSFYVLAAWFYAVLISGFLGILSKKTRSLSVLLLSGYVLSMELMGRMLKADPYMPYQLGSYFMLAVYTALMFDSYKTVKTHIGFIIVLLCVPGLIMIDQDFQNRFVGVFSGILCTGLAAIYFSRQRYTRSDFFSFAKCVVLPVVSMLIYLFFKTVPVTEIEFSLGASFATSGGFGPNQIATILGAAACFLLLPYLRGDRLFQTFKIANLLLIALLLCRGLLTFSRGGMLGCLLAVVLSYFYMAFTDGKNLGKLLLKLVFFTLLAVMVFQYSDELTGGKLSQRYKGESGGTIEGSREKDLKVITSGRNDIVAAEWNIFMDNFWFGVGPGNGYAARGAYYGKAVASHTEVTRLISEQGLPGLFIVLVFLFYPFVRISKSRSREERYYLISVFTLAIFTSFHSGMRTMLTPVLWGIGCADYWFAPKPAVAKQPSAGKLLAKQNPKPKLAL